MTVAPDLNTVPLDPAMLERMLVERTQERDEARNRAASLHQWLTERTIERDLARDLAASLEAELALVAAERDAARARLTTRDRVRADTAVGILIATHGTDFTATPRVLDDDIPIRCLCQTPADPGMHSATHCEPDWMGHR